MRGLDTNVLVRYVVQDDPVQSRRSGRLIEETAADGESLFLSCIVMCELVWVLESCYEATKNEIEEIIEKILLTGQFEVEHKSSVRAALEDFRAHKADFSDCLMGRVNRARGCHTTCSFDKAALGLPTFSQP